MENLINLIVLSIAAWRISSLFVSETGPANIFSKIRELAGITHDEDGHVLTVPETFFGGVFSCVWCFSIWVGFALTAVWLFSPYLAFVISLPFALSAMAIFIDRRMG